MWGEGVRGGRGAWGAAGVADPLPAGDNNMHTTVFRVGRQVVCLVASFVFFVFFFFLSDFGVLKESREAQYLQT